MQRKVKAQGLNNPASGSLSRVAEPKACEFSDDELLGMLHTQAVCDQSQVFEDRRAIVRARRLKQRTSRKNKNKKKKTQRTTVDKNIKGKFKAEDKGKKKTNEIETGLGRKLTNELSFRHRRTLSYQIPQPLPHKKPKLFSEEQAVSCVNVDEQINSLPSPDAVIFSPVSSSSPSSMPPLSPGYSPAVRRTFPHFLPEHLRNTGREPIFPPLGVAVKGACLTWGTPPGAAYVTKYVKGDIAHQLTSNEQTQPTQVTEELPETASWPCPLISLLDSPPQSPLATHSPRPLLCSAVDTTAPAASGFSTALPSSLEGTSSPRVLSPILFSSTSPFPSPSRERQFRHMHHAYSTSPAFILSSSPVSPLPEPRCHHRIPVRDADGTSVTPSTRAHAHTTAHVVPETCLNLEVSMTDMDREQLVSQQESPTCMVETEAIEQTLMLPCFALFDPSQVSDADSDTETLPIPARTSPAVRAHGALNSRAGTRDQSQKLQSDIQPCHQPHRVVLVRDTDEEDSGEICTLEPRESVHGHMVSTSRERVASGHVTLSDASTEEEEPPLPPVSPSRVHVRRDGHVPHQMTPHVLVECRTGLDTRPYTTSAKDGTATIDRSSSEESQEFPRTRRIRGTRKSARKSKSRTKGRKKRKSVKG